MTKQADQFHHDNMPAHSTALLQAFLAKHHITQICQPPAEHRFGSLWLLDFPEAKIDIERDEICECDTHTVHKFSQRHLTAEWLTSSGRDCSWIHSKVSSDWLPSYIKAMRPFLEIFKMAGYFLDSPHIWKCNLVHYVPHSPPLLNRPITIWKIQRHRSVR